MKSKSVKWLIKIQKLLITVSQSRNLEHSMRMFGKTMIYPCSVMFRTLFCRMVQYIRSIRVIDVVDRVMVIDSKTMRFTSGYCHSI